MNEMELLVYLHRNNKRQGPGSEETTSIVLALAGLDDDKSYKVVDIGCGIGAHTVGCPFILCMILACFKHTDGIG